nr:serine/threonine-protein kinase HT1-like [Tanacetum cinerariifolium]
MPSFTEVVRMLEHAENEIMSTVHKARFSTHNEACAGHHNSDVMPSFTEVVRMLEHAENEIMSTVHKARFRVWTDSQ